MLARARVWLDAIPGVRVEAMTAPVRTPAMGPPQPDYLNAVARLQTRLPPRRLLDALRALEDAAGRRRTVRWGPRTLDLDLLLVEGVVLDTPKLQLPHLRLSGRRFVLLPLARLDPGLVPPGGDASVAELLARLDADAPASAPVLPRGPA